MEALAEYCNLYRVRYRIETEAVHIVMANTTSDAPKTHTLSQHKFMNARITKLRNSPIKLVEAPQSEKRWLF